MRRTGSWALGICWLCASCAWGAAPQYTLTDLGTFSGDCYGLGINNNGQIAGWSYAGAGLSRAFVWENGVKTPLLPPAPTNRTSYCFAINDSGKVAGEYSTPADLHATIWQSGSPTDIGGGPTDTHSSHAWDLNNAGTVVGDYSSRPVYWDAANGMHDFGGTLGITGRAEGINSSEQIVGRYRVSSSVFHPFSWQGGVLTDIATFGGNDGSANDVSDSGQIVGWASTSSARHHAFVYNGGAPADLSVLPGMTDSEAQDQNVAGDIIGASYTTTTKTAVLWKGGQMYDLSNGLPVGWHFTSALAINDSGWITGYGEYSADSLIHGILLKPVVVPEPNLMALLPAIGLGFRMRAKRETSRRADQTH